MQWPAEVRKGGLKMSSKVEAVYEFSDQVGSQRRWNYNPGREAWVLRERELDFQVVTALCLDLLACPEQTTPKEAKEAIEDGTACLSHGADAS